MNKIYVYEGEKNTQYKDKIQECIEFILEKEFGDTIENEYLAKILGFNIEITKEYNKFKEKMSRIKNVLITKGRVLKSIPGVGYYILKPKQVSGYVYHGYIRRLDNLLGKSSMILNYTPKNDLSFDRTEEIYNLIELNTDLINEVDSTIQNSKYYDRKSYYDELED